VREVGRLIIVATIALSEFGCASFTRDRLTGWNCVSDVAAGDVEGSAFYSFDRTGRPSSDGMDWQWRATDRDLHITMSTLDREPFGIPPTITLVVDLPREFFRRRGRVEFRTGGADRPQADPRFVDRRYRQLQYNINIPASEFRKLAESGPLYLVAVDRSDAILRTVQLDPDAIARGEAVMHSAQSQAAAMASKLRERCTPEYESRDIVIA